MAVAAVKPFKYRGERVEPGQVLDPQPDATLARLLVDGRFARYADQTPEGTRPPGTGTGRRTRAVRSA
jgi:hypothetical protein